MSGVHIRAELEAELRERKRLTTRMLQALDAYWLGCEGLPKGRNPRGRYDSEDWWSRYEKYRAALSSEDATRPTPEPDSGFAEDWQWVQQSRGATRPTGDKE